MAEGKSREARTGDLKWVLEEIKKRQERKGEDAVKFGWLRLMLGFIALSRQTDLQSKGRGARESYNHAGDN